VIDMLKRAECLQEVALVGRQEERQGVNLGICRIENIGTDSSCSSPPHLNIIIQ